ncbi:putative transcription factor [Aspergillus thermomutatus]|uniref:Sorbicillinoid biosynthetic cluster transcription factor 2 n=1 Tax=Aspergillus thermomutatus TaxID=41047 RepID=A0A397HLQ4_ASPTH|nr:Sorbicillinoid biosynthetic cluster transcription factor 2 [Aspergillus thermomutatus]RHZ63907.1 Sorbicillinoid biosynthetic cluster transcription factor 2 [Aspergillus thermomutatus]
MRRRASGRNPVTVRQVETKRKPQVEHDPLIRSDVLVSASSESSPTLRTPSLKTPLKLTNKTPSAAELSSTLEHLDEDQEPDPDPDQARECYTAHGRFAGEVTAAIDVRAGLAPAATSHLVPFVDAPLFGEIDLHSPPYNVSDFPAGLPPRAYADRLVRIYWQYVDPVEPILGRERFFRDYEASYSKTHALLHADRDVWFGILNAVFALAVQRQESIPLQKRDEESHHYFQRAWALLRPETILWEPGTIELVQCLILMNRYLHCTNNQQKTWMTAGLATRIAQSMCCHLAETSSAKDSCSDTQLKQQVWASCVALDRCVSWSLGRTSAPSLIPLPNRANSMCLGGSDQHSGRYAERLARELELHEIGNQIQLAQTQTRNTLAARLGLPRLYQQDEYHTVAVQLDACLDKWEKDLPSDWKLQNLQKVVDRGSRAERYLLHLRLLHSRIYLYRPMLARFYSSKSHTATGQATSTPPSLSDRLLRECAGMCVETAQRVTSLIIETIEPNEPMGLLPWWYRIYYLHIAGTNFLAAMFRSDLFTESVSQSWKDVMSALRTHEHLSTYVQQCIRTFERLSTRILGTRYPTPDGSGDAPLEEAISGSLFDDIFQDLGVDCDNFLFGMEDYTNG